jgi:HK97 gp10 family phage protein
MMVTANMDGLLAYTLTVRDAINNGVMDAGKDIVDLASQFAPKETGDLSDSGDVQQISPGIVEVSFGNGLLDKRAIAQEYGTYNMPAQSYLAPAIKEINIALSIAKRLGI